MATTKRLIHDDNNFAFYLLVVFKLFWSCPTHWYTLTPPLTYAVQPWSVHYELKQKHKLWFILLPGFINFFSLSFVKNNVEFSGWKIFLTKSENPSLVHIVQLALRDSQGTLVCKYISLKHVKMHVRYQTLFLTLTLKFRCVFLLFGYHDYLFRLPYVGYSHQNHIILCTCRNNWLNSSNFLLQKLHKSWWRGHSDLGKFLSLNRIFFHKKQWRLTCKRATAEGDKIVDN